MDRPTSSKKDCIFQNTIGSRKAFRMGCCFVVTYNLFYPKIYQMKLTHIKNSFVLFFVLWFQSNKLLNYALHSKLYWQKSWSSKCLGISGLLKYVSVHHDIVIDYTVRRFIFTGNLKTKKNIKKVLNNEIINTKLQIWIAMTDIPMFCNCQSNN